MSQVFDVRYVANLARIALTEEEISAYEPQLAKILDYMQKLDGVDLSQVVPMAHANSVMNVTRADDARESMPVESALANSPQTAMNQFVMPKVVE